MSDEDILKKIEDYRELVEIVLPPIVEILLRQGKLDPSRLDDRNYIFDVIDQNSEIFKNLTWTIALDDQFLVSAQEAASADRPAVAIVLVATAIEHKINFFYRNILKVHTGLSSEQATDIIRSNINIKIGWLMSLVTGHELSNDLKNQIKQIMDMRNAFVHYKSHLTLIDDKNDSHRALMDQVQKIGLENILSIPNKLESELEQIIREISPTYGLAVDATQSIVGSNEQKRSG